MNYAGFGMITDLRNNLYNCILRRSAAFFQKHTTGTLISTIINDIERVQYAMSSVLAEFLQQFFTFVFMAYAVVVLGREACLGAVAVRPFYYFFRRQDRTSGAPYYAARTGQAGRHSEHPARNHHRQPHCEGLQHGVVGDCPLSQGRPATFPGESCARWRRPRSVRH